MKGFEDFLDVIEIVAAADQLGGATAAEGVGGNVDLQSRLAGFPTHNTPEGVVGMQI